MDLTRGLECTCSGSGVDCRTAVGSIRRPGPASAGLMIGIDGAALADDDAADGCVGFGVATVWEGADSSFMLCNQGV